MLWLQVSSALFLWWAITLFQGFSLCVCVCLLSISRFGLGFGEICGLWHREGYWCFFWNKHLLQNDCKCSGLDHIVGLLQFCVPPAADHKESRNYLQFDKKETWSSKTSLKYTLNKCVFLRDVIWELPTKLLLREVTLSERKKSSGKTYCMSGLRKSLTYICCREENSLAKVYQ